MPSALDSHDLPASGPLPPGSGLDRSLAAAELEIYHSIIQRKVLAPNDFANTAEVARTLNDFEHHYNQIAEPFDWTFTRQDLADLLNRVDQQTQREPPVALAA